MQIIRAVRPMNLFLTIFLYAVAYYVFLPPGDFLPLLYLLMAVLFIEAGGNTENDMQDTETDLVNGKTNFYSGNPKAWHKFLPYLMYGAGLVWAAIFLRTIRFPAGYMAYFISVVILLMNYNYSLKKMPLIGNVIISVLSVLLLFNLLIFFDLPETSQKTVLWLSGILFFTSLNREMVKDIADRKGDRLSGYQTLGVVSVKRALQFIFIQSIIIGLFLIGFLRELPLRAVLFYIFFTGIPWIYGLYLLFSLRENPTGYINRLQKLYKWMMFSGILGLMTI
jgi:4-hydroxybenzoate polyprenyltransferase